jgi:outer membrane protein TolC
MLRYLPTFGVTLGYQQYDHDYAETVKLSIPEKTGVFKMGIDQIIYSPALVTNILIKKKMVDFSKYETPLKEQDMGIDVALMYIDVLMLENMIKVQQEYVKESRENLAIARVREQMGVCGQEESLRWAAQLNVNEQNLLDMRAELRNLKIGINKILYKNQTVNFELAPLRANDPAFYTSEINIIDYVTTETSLEKFTEMLVEEAYKVAPELAKLRAAIKIKNYESGMYYQKFILPDAKLSLEYTSLTNREFGGPSTIAVPVLGSVNMGTPAATNGRIGIFAQWTPFEGGTKIAEIARVKAEKEELKLYEQEVKTAIEQHIRDTINKALAGYFSIEKNYKASYSAGENYYRVKDLYLRGEVPIAQIVDAQKIYLDSKVKAMNSQYTFFKELVWVQRGICAVDWTHASPEAKAFIQSIKDNIEKKSDIELL